jgi:hypothetical protein
MLYLYLVLYACVVAKGLIIGYMSWAEGCDI